MIVLFKCHQVYTYTIEPPLRINPMSLNRNTLPSLVLCCLLVLVGLVQELPITTSKYHSGMTRELELYALDEVLLIGARCVDRGLLDGGRCLAAAANSCVGTAEEKAEDTHGELFRRIVSQLVLMGGCGPFPTEDDAQTRAVVLT